MALGSRGQKNFGLSTNLTLPMVTIDPDPNTNTYMPGGEQIDKRKKHARFALDQEGSEDRGKKKSWFSRLFKRSKKSDQVAPDPAPTATPRAALGDFDDDDEELVKLMRTESNPELSTTSPDGGKSKKKKKTKKKKDKTSDRKTKAQSTAFEHLSPASRATVPSMVHILLKPHSPSNGSRKVVLKHREGSNGYGIHLSGGMPPVTITYVEPRSEADQQGVKVGDIVLDVNGLNCRKKVDMAQLMQLKMLVQQTPAAKITAKQEQIDEAAWGKIKSKQDEMDADQRKIRQQPASAATSPKDKASSSPQAAAEEVKPKDKQTRLSSSGGIGEPLATSSPLRDSDRQQKKKTKKDSTVSQNDDQPETLTKRFSTMEDGKKQKRQSGVVSGTLEDKKKKRQSASLSVEENGHDRKKRSTSLSVDENGHEKKKRQSGLSVDENGRDKKRSTVDENGHEKKKRSTSLSVDENGHEKKKRQSAGLSVDENANSKSRSQSTSLSVDEVEHKKQKRQSASLSVDDNGHKKKKRQSASMSNGQSAGLSVDEPPASLSVDGNDQTGTEKRKKRSSKSRSETPDASKLSSSHVKVVEVEINASTEEEPRNRKSSREHRAKTGQADGPADVIDRSDRNRRSSSPKARYRMGEAEELKIVKIGESNGEGKAAKAKVTVGEIKKKSKDEGKKKKKSKEDEKEKSENGGKKKSKDDTKKSKDDKKKDSKSSKKSSKKEKSNGEKEKSKKDKKKKKSLGDPPSATAAASAVSSAIAVAAAIPKGSAAVSGTVESNTMTYTSKHASRSSLNASKSSLNTHGSKSSLNTQGSKNSMEKSEEGGKNATLPRRMKRDQSSSMGSVASHSISSSDLREETEKAFRKELKEASQSQHDMSELINIDPNIKVKKGGVVKEGRAVERRPSLPSFDPTPPPEPKEASPISSGAVEDNILDPDFKMKKSGVVVGRKTSSSARPTILNESKETTPPKDIVPGEMKYNMQVSEDVDGNVEMDISAVPEISPSLGLVAGRDRLDTVNRSLTKRRPPSQWKPGDEAGAAASPSTSRTTAARKLFESKQQDNTTVERRFSKTIDKPVKTLGVSQGPQDKKPAPQTTPGKDQANKGAVPNWVAMAQIRQKRLSQAEEKAKQAPQATPAPAAEVPKATEPASTNTSTPQDSSVPQIGTVAARLAMFQRR